MKNKIRSIYEQSGSPNATVATANVLNNDYVSQISASLQMAIESFDEQGNPAIAPVFGYYPNSNYAIAGSVNVLQLLSSANVQLSTVDICDLVIPSSGGAYDGNYQVYDSNMQLVGTYECNGESLIVPMYEVWQSSGSWDFMVIPEDSSGFFTLSIENAVLGVYYEKLLGISVTRPPNKTQYVQGDTFQPEGMRVNAMFEGISQTREIENPVFYVTGKSISDGLVLTEGDAVTVSHTHKGITKTVELGLTVNGVGENGYFSEVNVSNSEIGENPRINVQTQGLKYTHRGLSIGIKSYALDVNLVYDSQMKDCLCQKNKGMPNGWKLDAHQYVLQDGGTTDIPTYKYIDGNGYAHKFVRYENSQTDFFDIEGLGLVLTLGDETQIKDSDGNVMTFDAEGRLSQTVSGLNSQNKKNYVYLDDGRLSSIFDTRKESRKLQFTYNQNGFLQSISSHINDVCKETLNCTYSNGELVEIGYPAMQNETSNYALTKFSYNEIGKLSLIVDAQSNYATKIFHVFNSFRQNYDVSKISYGYMSNEVFVEDSFKSVLSTLICEQTKLNYEVQLINEKGVVVVLKVDSNKRVSAPLERVLQGSSKQYRSMQKELGYRLENPASSGADSINGIVSFELSQNSQGVYECPLWADLSDASRVIPISQTSLKDSKHFKLRFWAKLVNYNANEKVYAVLEYVDSGTTKTQKTLLDETIPNSWQKVEIPFSLELAETDLSEARIYFYKVEQGEAVLDLAYPVFVCDFVISRNNKNGIYFNNGERSLEDATKMTFFDNPYSGTTVNYSKEGFYVTEQDILRTVRDYFKSQGQLGVYLCNGTMRKRVLWDFTLATDTGNFFGISNLLNGTEPNWFIQSISPDGKVILRRSYKFTTNDCIETTETFLQHEDGSFSTEPTFTSRKKTDLNGRVKQEIDSNGTIHEYEYLEDGTLKSEKLVYVSNGDRVEKTVYSMAESYDESAENFVVKERNETTETWQNYNTERGSLDKIQLFEYTNNAIGNEIRALEYGYDSRYTNLTSLTAKEGLIIRARNQMSYANGELQTASDGATSYKFSHDKQTKTTSISVQNGQVEQVSEQIVENTRLNEVAHKYYVNDNTFVAEVTKYDDWGNKLSVISGDKYANFEYSHNGAESTAEQNANSQSTEVAESFSVATLKKVTDGFSERTTEYEYSNGAVAKETVTKNNESRASITIEKVGSTGIKHTIENVEQTSTLEAEGTTLVLTNKIGIIPVGEFSKRIEKDEFGRIKKETLFLKNASIEQDDFSTEYTYDSERASLLRQRYYVHEKSSTVGNQSASHYVLKGVRLKETLSYDAQGNVVSVNEEFTAGNVPYVVQTQGEPYSNGAITFSREVTKSYNYDSQGKLRKETIGAQERNYHYDANGRISLFNGNYCAYNAKGQITSFGGKALSYDNRGNCIHDGTRAYEWTRGRLLKQAGSLTFEYDHLGQRSKKGTTEYYYNGTNLIAEKRNNEWIRYFHDTTGICGFIKDGVKYEFIKNVFGDVIGIIENNELVAYYSYDAWGNCEILYDKFQGTNAETIAQFNPIRYRGYYYDVETALYYCNSRYYNPQMGMFISPDSIEYLDPESINGLNLYAYCGNDPVNYYDPTGHSAILIGLIIGAVIGAGIGFGTATYIDYQDDGQIFNGSVAWYDYLGATVLGGAIGAGIGAGVGYIAPQIAGALSSFASTSFSLGGGLSLSASGAATMSAGLTITGAQILQGAGILSGITIMASIIGKSGGYTVKKFPNDHDPTHVHIFGDDIADKAHGIRIGLDGNPLPGQGKLPPGARKALKKLWELILKALSK